MLALLMLLVLLMLLMLVLLGFDLLPCTLLCAAHTIAFEGVPRFTK
jgi:hypothetical protein